MNISMLQEKRNKLMADASALVAGDITPEIRAQFDTMIADVAVVDADIARLTAIEEHRSSLRNPVNQPRPNPAESHDPEERAEVRKQRQAEALRTYMRTGRVESRDLTAAGNAVAIPVGFDSTVIDAQKSYGEIYDVVTVMKTDSGEPIKLVLDNDTTNSLTSVTVGTAASEVDPTISGVTLQVSPYTTGVVKIDNGFLMDAGFDLESWLRDKFLKRFFRGASNLIVAGEGGNVASLSTQAQANFVTSAVVNKLTYADFASAIGLLDPAYHQNAVFAMNNSALSGVIGLSDSNGRPLFLPNYGNASQGYVGTIVGYPVKLVTQLSNVATGNFPVLFGDFKAGYTFRQVNPGIGILRLNELYAAGYETGFVGFARVGGVNTDAGTHPVISIKIQ